MKRQDLLTVASSFGLLAALGAAPATVERTVAPPGLAGAWSLESFDVEESQTRVQPRFGPNPAGYLIYTPSGRMSAVLQGIHREKLDAPNGSSSSREQIAQSLSNFLAYAGRYEVKGDHVFHHVETSVFTNLIGVTLERRFQLEGDTLTIRTLPPEIWGSANVLVWKRA